MRFLSLILLALVLRLAVIVVLLASPPADYAHFPPELGKQKVLITRVIDGDTVEVAFLVPVTLRLHGINAPERNTPEGQGAKQLLEALLPAGSLATADLFGREKFGRTLAELTTPDGRRATRVLLDAGRGRPWDGRGPRPP